MCARHIHCYMCSCSNSFRLSVVARLARLQQRTEMKHRTQSAAVNMKLAEQVVGVYIGETSDPCTITCEGR